MTVICIQGVEYINETNEGILVDMPMQKLHEDRVFAQLKYNVEHLSEIFELHLNDSEQAIVASAMHDAFKDVLAKVTLMRRIYLPVASG